MYKLVFPCLLLYSMSAFACFPARVELATRVKNTSHIVVGFVTGKFLKEFEERLDNPNLPIQTNEGYILRVKIIEELKGHFQKDAVKPNITNCGSGGGQLKQKVLVFFDGNYWYVRPFNKLILKKIKRLIEI